MEAAGSCRIARNAVLQDGGGDGRLDRGRRCRPQHPHQHAEHLQLCVGRQLEGPAGELQQPDAVGGTAVLQCHGREVDVDHHVVVAKVHPEGRVSVPQGVVQDLSLVGHKPDPLVLVRVRDRPLVLPLRLVGILRLGLVEWLVDVRIVLVVAQPDERSLYLLVVVERLEVDGLDAAGRGVDRALFLLHAEVHREVPRPREELLDQRVEVRGREGAGRELLGGVVRVVADLKAFHDRVVHQVQPLLRGRARGPAALEQAPHRPVPVGLLGPDQLPQLAEQLVDDPRLGLLVDEDGLLLGRVRRRRLALSCAPRRRRAVALRHDGGCDALDQRGDHRPELGRVSVGGGGVPDGTRVAGREQRDHAAEVVVAVRDRLHGLDQRVKDRLAQVVQLSSARALTAAAVRGRAPEGSEDHAVQQGPVEPLEGVALVQRGCEQLGRQPRPANPHPVLATPEHRERAERRALVLGRLGCRERAVLLALGHVLLGQKRRGRQRLRAQLGPLVLVCNSPGLALVRVAVAPEQRPLRRELLADKVGLHVRHQRRRVLELRPGDLGRRLRLRRRPGPSSSSFSSSIVLSRRDHLEFLQRAVEEFEQLRPEGGLGARP